MIQRMQNNRAMLCGPLAQDPEFVELGSKAIPAVRFTVIGERGDRTKGEQSTFCRCTAWRGLREALRGCVKGDSVLVLANVSESTKGERTFTDYTAEYVSAAVKEAAMLLQEKAAPDGFPAGTQVAMDEELPF